jgi:hypothetical protein
VAIAPGAGSRLFDTYILPISRIIHDFGDGTTKTFEAGNDLLIREEFPAQIRVFRGRETSMELRLNDAMVELEFQLGTATFNRQEFEFANMPSGGVVRSFLSDYMMFDIAGMGGLRPQMSNGQFADRVYFSGDRFLLSEQGPSGYIEAIGGDSPAPQPGEFVDPFVVANTPAPGEYRLLVADPNDPSETPAMITALRGMFKPFYDPSMEQISLIIPLATFDVLLMPTSQGSDVMQILLVAHNRQGDVSNIYFGDADLSTGAFVAYPIANLPSGSTAGSISGTLSGFVDESGAVVNIGVPEDSERIRSGNFTIVGSRPSEFPGAGTFVVFR